MLQFFLHPAASVPIWYAFPHLIISIRQDLIEFNDLTAEQPDEIYIIRTDKYFVKIDSIQTEFYLLEVEGNEYYYLHYGSFE